VSFADAAAVPVDGRLLGHSRRPIVKVVAPVGERPSGAWPSKASWNSFAASADLKPSTLEAVLGWLGRRAESRRLMRALKQSMEDSTPPAFVSDWIGRQPLDTQGWLRNLRFSMGGQPVHVIEAKINNRGWQVPREVVTALAASLARAPEYYTDSDGKGHVVVRTPDGPVKLDALLATGTVQFGPGHASA
jgi:hypothetical protein